MFFTLCGSRGDVTDGYILHDSWEKLSAEIRPKSALYLHFYLITDFI